MRHPLLPLPILLVAGLALAAEDSIPPGPPDPSPLAPARLMIGRDSSAPNACDVTLFINGQLAAELAPDQSVTLNVPSGEVGVSASLSSAGYCAESNTPGAVQSAILKPGETRQYRVMVDTSGVFLSPLID
ncbi:hypothetical protein [Pseudomonas mangiferae]|uniref:Uncharacterized protein n=1 Tax=Pseudomonas mangiferae TaxID=2593654 RepID=A0A553H2J8_9PSED|nr:hypothetical protein [Pseudomonas mangiferae]TRX75946.1 hypothetical protein FM069_05780 [Pseudomonas mangiferae]